MESEDWGPHSRHWIPLWTTLNHYKRYIIFHQIYINSIISALTLFLWVVCTKIKVLSGKKQQSRKTFGAVIDTKFS
jgi:hypothetical protein